jgi:hemolysin D
MAFLSNAVERILAGFERHDEREFLPAALEVVETPPSPAARAIAFLIVLFFTLAVAWAFIGHVDIMATATGRILPAGDVKLVQPLDQGLVRAIHVHNGQKVRRGELLVELDPTDPMADRDRLSRDAIQADLDVARLRGLADAFPGTNAVFVVPPGLPADAVRQAKAAMQAQADQQAARIADLTQQISQKDAEVAEGREQSEKTRAALPMLAEKNRINEMLTSRGYGSALLALDAAQGLSDARHDLDITGRRIQESMAARGALSRQRDGQRAQYQADVLADLRKAQEQQNELRQDLIKARSKSSATQLRAPTDGVVEALAIHTLHGVVLPGQRLMTIVPDGRHLMIEAQLANKDVGFVYPGQSVKVKIETFNFTRYGIIEGTVIDVSRDAVNQDPRVGIAGNMPPPAADATPVPAATSPTYVARIALPTTSMTVDGRKRDLTPGMSVTAEIRIGSRSIADYLLSPLARATDESLHEQ